MYRIGSELGRLGASCGGMTCSGGGVGACAGAGAKVMLCSKSRDSSSCCMSDAGPDVSIAGTRSVTPCERELHYDIISLELKEMERVLRYVIAVLILREDRC
jgi:hypothetical protein